MNGKLIETIPARMQFTGGWNYMQLENAKPTGRWEITRTAEWNTMRVEFEYYVQPGYSIFESIACNFFGRPPKADVRKTKWVPEDCIYFVPEQKIYLNDDCNGH